MRAKKYINALLYVFIASGVLTGFLWAIRAGFWSGLQFGFLFAIGLTVFVALVILPLDFLFTKNVSNKELDVNQNEELKLAGNAGDIFQRSLEILSRLGMIKGIQPLRYKMMIWLEQERLYFLLEKKSACGLLPRKKGK
jgi:ABC-type protease/lipase transport system fused ATPase/permease subunit